MWHYLQTALRMALLTLLLVGIVYPLVMTGLAQLIFPRQANGSLIVDRGVVRGSTLIGQPFAGPGYFHPRPSAAGSGYDSLASGGANLGPTNKTLSDRIRKSVEDERAATPRLKDVPVDMVTTSGSGLDPDITPANADAQAPRVAMARKIDEATVRDLIKRNTTPRQFGVLGEPRINVLQLNRALDALPGQAQP